MFRSSFASSTGDLIESIRLRFLRSIVGPFDLSGTNSSPRSSNRLAERTTGQLKVDWVAVELWRLATHLLQR